MFNNINIYWINLERAQHRKEKMLNLFQEHNLTHKRIEAIDGLKINENEIKSQYKVNEKMNVFEIACALTHLKAIQDAYDNNLENVLIFEDDVNFEYLKYQTIPIEELLKKLIELKGECLQLAMINQRKIIPSLIKNKNRLIKFNSDGAQAYLLTRQGMKTVLDNFHTQKYLEVSEHMIFKVANNYVVKPYFSYEFYKNNTSYIRENNKSAHATQTWSKLLWDKYYLSKDNNE